MSFVSGPFPDPLKDAAYVSSASSGHLNYQCHTGLQSPIINLLSLLLFFLLFGAGRIFSVEG